MEEGRGRVDLLEASFVAVLHLVTSMTIARYGSILRHVLDERFQRDLNLTFDVKPTATDTRDEASAARHLPEDFKSLLSCLTIDRREEDRRALVLDLYGR